MVDTNSNPNNVSFPIPSNDDSTKSIRKILEVITEAIKEGLLDREQANAEKVKQKKEKEEELKKNKETTEK